MSEEPNLKEMLDKNKMKIIVVLFVFSLMILLVGGYRLVKFKQCEAKGGFVLEDKTCYFPKSEWEREQFEKYGYLRQNYPSFVQEQIWLINVSVNDSKLKNVKNK